MNRYFLVEKNGSYVQDVQLSGGTKNGTYWASYTPIEEFDFDSRNTWITYNVSHARGLALLVEGSVVRITKQDNLKEL